MHHTQKSSALSNALIKVTSEQREVQALATIRDEQVKIIRLNTALSFEQFSSNDFSIQFHHATARETSFFPNHASASGQFNPLFC
jgi:hypothetical protein